MRTKLFESELKVMEVLWREGAVSAKRVVEVLEKQVGWNKNTTYTVIKKCVDKGVIDREDPGFICCPLITQEEVRRQETDALIDRLFEGSKELFFASLTDGRLNPSEADALRRLVEKLK